MSWSRIARLETAQRRIDSGATCCDEQMASIRALRAEGLDSAGAEVLLVRCEGMLTRLRQHLEFLQALPEIRA